MAIRSADLQIGCSGDVHIPALVSGVLQSRPTSVDLEVHATAELEFGATRCARFLSEHGFTVVHHGFNDCRYATTASASARFIL